MADVRCKDCGRKHGEIEGRGSKFSWRCKRCGAENTIDTAS